MTFDNDLSDKPTLGSQLKSHLPIFLLAGALFTAFIGLHAAANAVLILAALHVVALVAVLALRRRQVAAGANK